MSKGRVNLLLAIKKQIRIRTAEPTGDHKSSHTVLAYLSWLAWHCGRFAAVPSFLEAARSDIVAILYAGAIGMERSAYLHARSLLENFVRHCHYDARPALFAVRHFEREDNVQDKWSELVLEVQRLPHFRPTRNRTDSSTSAQNEKASATILDLFPELQALYGKCSSFVHGSTVRYRSAYEGVGSITLDKTRTEDLEELLQQVGEVSLLLLAMAHLGPYLLISQPVRRYMMLAMRKEARSRFLRCMGRVSLPWAKHQRAAALRTLHERKKGPVPSRHGLLLHEDGLLLVVTPETSR